MFSNQYLGLHTWAATTCCAWTHPLCAPGACCRCRRNNTLWHVTAFCMFVQACDTFLHLPTVCTYAIVSVALTEEQHTTGSVASGALGLVPKVSGGTQSIMAHTSMALNLQEASASKQALGDMPAKLKVAKSHHCINPFIYLIVSSSHHKPAKKIAAEDDYLSTLALLVEGGVAAHHSCWRLQKGLCS